MKRREKRQNRGPVLPAAFTRFRAKSFFKIRAARMRGAAVRIANMSPYGIIKGEGKHDE